MHLPLPEDEKDRILQAAFRRRLLEGAWQQDALNREADFFAPEVREMLPAPELSHNPFASVHAQLAVLYDEDPELEEGHTAGDITPLLPPQLWPLCQERLLHTSATNECAMRVDIYTDPNAISYRVVYADLIACALPSEDGRDPQTPVYIEELRRRIRDGEVRWTKEIWDVRNPAVPAFAIQELDSANGSRWVDATQLYLPDLPVGEWPPAYRTRDGRPILPYVLYHKRFGGHMWAPMIGSELATGTLTVAAAWTMWLSGLRDGSHPQRVLIDGDPQITAQNSQVGANIVRMNPQTVMQVRAIKRPDGTYSSPSIGQWQPAMDPKTFGESVTEFEASLAVHAGLSPADVQKGHDAMSGYAIVVSRQGQRKASKRFVKTCLLGDQLLLSKAAALYNTAVGAEVASEDPAAYTLCYPALDSMDLTHEEEERMEREEDKAKAENLKAKVEIVEKMLTIGLIDKTAALGLLADDLNENFEGGAAVAVPPDLKPVLAEIKAAIEAADLASVPDLLDEARALLGEAIDGTTATALPATLAATMQSGPAPDTSGLATAPVEKAADTALNGAQVEAAASIVAQVAAKQLPRATGVQMLIEFFNIDTARAERIMGPVGSTFFVEAPVAG